MIRFFVAFVMALSVGCCKTHPPVYLPPEPSLTLPPPARPVVEGVACTHPEVYRCFTRDGMWDLVMYLNAIRVYADEAWTKCGVIDETSSKDKAVDSQ